jgi:hypothetical protein
MNPLPTLYTTPLFGEGYMVISEKVKHPHHLELEVSLLQVKIEYNYTNLYLQGQAGDKLTVFMDPF